MDKSNPSNHARQALLNNVAAALAAEAADALEPLAGQPIGAEARAALAADVLVALGRHVPALGNLRGPDMLS